MAIQDDRGFNQIYEQNKVNLIRLKRRADWMIGEMEPSPAKKTLEIGCGTGYMSHYIAERTNMQVIGSDLCKPFIEEAKAKFSLPNLSYEVLDFNEAAASIHNKFDYILGNGILHHLYYHLDEVFLTLKDLLNAGGKIIFMEPNIYNPYVAAIFKNGRLRKWAHLEPDEMAFSKGFIRQKLEAAGFQDSRIFYKDFLLPGIPEFMVRPSVVIGDLLERTPLKYVSQSILISAGHGFWEKIRGK
jgi:2-polyprenyl-3-methyl-5-hydroxy-6-metoxy-1,4-benzoquinol methylase